MRNIKEYPKAKIIVTLTTFGAFIFMEFCYLPLVMKGKLPISTVSVSPFEACYHIFQKYHSFNVSSLEITN